MITLGDIVIALGDSCRLVGDTSLHPAFNEVVHDSREVRPGSLFVALKGQRDGHDFIADARHRGAIGTIAERAVDDMERQDGEIFVHILVPDPLQALQQLARFWRKKWPVEVIGVTGSVGKTTTKETISSVLAQRFSVLKNPGNLNTEIGLPLSLLRLDGSHQKAVLEMGMYNIGDIRLLCSIAGPRIGVITNVGPSHLERLGSLARVAQAKAELVEALPSDGYAILNGDDPIVREFSEVTKARPFLYGTSSDCNLRAIEVISRGLQGLELKASYGGKTFRLMSPLPGRHNLYAALAAISIGIVEGLSWEEIRTGLETTQPDSRIKILAGPNSSTIIDDTYNASPASMLGALDLLGELDGRRLAVLGDMMELGSFEEEGHRQVGRKAAKVLDGLVVVGRRARWIGEEAIQLGLTKVIFVNNSKEVRLEPEPGDYILVKGSRAMAMEQVVEEIQSPVAATNTEK